MWRGFGRFPYRRWRRGMRWGWGGPGYWGPRGGWGWGYGPRRGPCCCLFFALPLALLPLALMVMLMAHVL